MPIAAYTLDDGFDFSKISVLDPIVVARANGQPPVADNLPLQKDDKFLSSNSPTQLGRKRPFDSEGDSQAQIDQPPKKKARMLGTTFIKDRRQETTFENTAEKGGGGPNLPAPPAPPPPRVCFSKVSSLLPSGRVSKAVKTFESLIVYPKTISPPLTPKKLEKDVAISPLNPHTLFWNDLFAKSFPRDGSTVLELSVDDLLQAPRTKGTLFKVNKSYRGKKFINLDYV